MNPRRTLPRAVPVLAVLLVTAVAGFLLVRGPLGTSGPVAAADALAQSPYDASGRPRGRVGRPANLPNLILIVVDSLRDDVVRGDTPSRGGVRATAGTTPYLASLAARGVRFTEAVSHAPWTAPSMASILCGLLPSDTRTLDGRRAPQLPVGTPTFAEILSKSYGYDTAAFVDGPWWTAPATLLRGFEQGMIGFAFEYAEQDLEPWLKVRDPRQPFFLLLHTMEAHEPYGRENRVRGAPGPTPEMFAEVAALDDPAEMTRLFLLDRARRIALTSSPGDRAARVVRYMADGYGENPRPGLASELRTAYLDGVAWTDRQIARTMAMLEARGLLENTMVVATADHGEAFGEHGHLGHGVALYDELVHVPLVVVGPGPFTGGREVAGTVALSDVLPTFFEVAGLPIPTPIEGRSLKPVLAGASRGRPVVSEEMLSIANMGRTTEGTRASVRTSRWKFVITHDRLVGSIVEELYDVRADPGETRNLVNDVTGGMDSVDVATCRAIHVLRQRVAGVLAEDRVRNGDGPKADEEVAWRAAVSSPCDTAN